MGSLSRGLLTSTAFIYSNSVFVSRVGSDSYSLIVFYSQIACMALYSAFLFTSRRAANWLYAGVLALTLALCAGFWLFPGSIGTLFGFTLGVFVLDIMGINVAIAALQDKLSPAVQGKVSQRILLFDLIGRVSGSVAMLALSREPWLGAFYPVALATGAVHMFCFAPLLARPGAGDGAEPRAEPPSVVIGKAADSLRFVFRNPLVRVALIALVWSRFAKFLVELAYYGALEAELRDAGRISSYVGGSNSVSLVVSIVFQALVSERIFSRLALSTLFGLLPIGVFCLGFLSLVVPPFWPMIVANVFFQCGFRVIHFPAFRQCLLPVPRRLNHTIFSTVNLIALTATMLISGSMAGLKGVFGQDQLVILTLALSGGLFFVLADMDSFYVSNLWSHYREKLTGRWQPVANMEQLIDVPEAADAALEAAPAPRERAVEAIRAGYLGESDEAGLRRVVAEHRALLEASRPGERLAGIRAMSWVGLAEFDGHLASKASGDADPAVRHEAAKALHVQRLVWEGLGDAVPISALARARDLLDEVDDERARSDRAARLALLLRAPDRDWALSWIGALTAAPAGAARDALLLCADPARGRVRVRPLVASLYERGFAASAPLRPILLGLRKRPEDDAALRRALNARIYRLLRSDFSFWDEAGRTPVSRRMSDFLCSLFLDEWRLGVGELKPVIRTVEDFAALRAEELEVLCSMHLELFKDSAHAPAWKLLFARRPSRSERDRLIRKFAAVRR